MTDFYPYNFTAEIVQHDVGSARYRYTVIFVPQALKADLPLGEYPKLRVSGEIDHVPIEAAFTPVRAEHYVLLSKKLLAAIDKSLGDEVEMRFRIADQVAVDVPETLLRFLNSDPKLKSLWDDTTAGKRRALAYMVSSAKRLETQEKRIEKVASVLRGEIDLKGNPIR
ncbi:MAG: YdeI/OmpD-associated family protein [Pseudomonadota bacterium]